MKKPDHPRKYDREKDNIEEIGRFRPLAERVTLTYTEADLHRIMDQAVRRVTFVYDKEANLVEIIEPKKETRGRGDTEMQ